MQQNDALFQIKLLNVSVYLVSVRSVAEQTLSVCIELLAVRDSAGLVPLRQLNWWVWTRFLRKEIMFFGAFSILRAEQLLWHSECERGQRQLVKVGRLGRWARWLGRFGRGEAGGWWLQQILAVLLEHGARDWEQSWEGWSWACSAECPLTKFLASVEEASDGSFLSRLRKGRLAHTPSRWTNRGQAW